MKIFYSSKMILLMSLLATFVALSILGNVVGYWFGSKVAIICTTSKIVFGSKENIWFSPKIFRKYGGKTFSLFSSNISNFCAYSCWNRFYG
jgi:membrane protein YqaA with SNARE-associated domain